MAQNEAGSPVRARSVQEYIDETPFWANGARLTSAPLTRMQWRIWALASAGKFFEGLAVFMTGVALPLIVKEFGLDAMGKGLASAAPLFGILVGASLLGGMADRYGRKRVFIAEMALFLLFLILLAVSPNFPWLLCCLFGLGLALGCDYPTGHMIISETIPSRDRGKIIISAFGFQAFGAMAGAAVGYLCLYESPSPGAWRLMYAVAAGPALVALAGRFFIPDSPAWLVSRDRTEEARRHLAALLRRTPPYPCVIRLQGPNGLAGDPARRPQNPLRRLFSRGNRRAAILASIPWFLQDLGTYGIGVFTPTILSSALGAKIVHARNLADLIHNDMMAAKGAAFIDLLLLAGIVAAALLADKAGRIRLQIIGFLGCAAGLALATLSVNATGEARMLYLYSGFMLFNFMTNMGPNAMTYLISGEVFPVDIRGLGAGMSASFGKIGAVITAFLFPFLLKDLGVGPLLWALTGTSLLGALVTFLFRIETKGVDLENMERSRGVLEKE